MLHVCQRGCLIALRGAETEPRPSCSTRTGGTDTAARSRQGTLHPACARKTQLQTIAYSLAVLAASQLSAEVDDRSAEFAEEIERRRLAEDKVKTMGVALASAGGDEAEALEKELEKERERRRRAEDDLRYAQNAPFPRSSSRRMCVLSVA